MISSKQAKRKTYEALEEKMKKAIETAFSCGKYVAKVRYPTIDKEHLDMLELILRVNGYMYDFGDHPRPNTLKINWYV